MVRHAITIICLLLATQAPAQVPRNVMDWLSVAAAQDSGGGWTYPASTVIHYSFAEDTINDVAYTVDDLVGTWPQTQTTNANAWPSHGGGVMNYDGAITPAQSYSDYTYSDYDFYPYISSNITVMMKVYFYSAQKTTHGKQLFYGGSGLVAGDWYLNWFSTDNWRFAAFNRNTGTVSSPKLPTDEWVWITVSAQYDTGAENTHNVFFGTDVAYSADLNPSSPYTSRVVRVFLADALFADYRNAYMDVDEFYVFRTFVYTNDISLIEDVIANGDSD